MSQKILFCRSCIRRIPIKYSFSTYTCIYCKQGNIQELEQIVTTSPPNWESDVLTAISLGYPLPWTFEYLGWKSALSKKEINIYFKRLRTRLRQYSIAKSIETTSE